MEKLSDLKIVPSLPVTKKDFEFGFFAPKYGIKMYPATETVVCMLIFYYPDLLGKRIMNQLYKAGEALIAKTLKQYQNSCQNPWLI